MLTSHYGIPIFAQGLNAEYLMSAGHIGSLSDICVINEKAELCGFEVKAFSTPHDTRQSCGYRIITPDNKVICICTDLGEVTQAVHENLLGAELILLESNYDYNMLRNGPYPYPLKQRISSANGHLDNRDSAKELLRLVENGTTRIILGHLSRHNNRPDIAEQTAESLMEGARRNVDYILMTAPIETGGEVMIV